MFQLAVKVEMSVTLDAVALKFAVNEKYERESAAQIPVALYMNCESYCKIILR